MSGANSYAGPMSERWTWTCHDETGEARQDLLDAGEFPSQAEAEAYLSESWEELAHAGVAAVTLMSEGAAVYGPMSLEPPT